MNLVIIAIVLLIFLFLDIYTLSKTNITTKETLMPLVVIRLALVYLVGFTALTYLYIERKDRGCPEHEQIQEPIYKIKNE